MTKFLTLPGKNDKKKHKNLASKCQRKRANTLLGFQLAEVETVNSLEWSILLCRNFFSQTMYLTHSVLASKSKQEDTKSFAQMGIISA